MPRPRKAPAAAPTDTVTAHQTHGALTPQASTSSVGQLTRTKNVASGSAGSFVTMGEYNRYLTGLTTHDLHKHAMNEKVVPIDDRRRLITRLETAWAGNHRPLAVLPKHTWTAEQRETQEALRKKMLGRFA